MHIQIGKMYSDRINAFRYARCIRIIGYLYSDRIDAYSDRIDAYSDRIDACSDRIDAFR